MRRTCCTKTCCPGSLLPLPHSISGPPQITKDLEMPTARLKLALTIQSPSLLWSVIHLLLIRSQTKHVADNSDSDSPTPTRSVPASLSTVRSYSRLKAKAKGEKKIMPSGGRLAAGGQSCMPAAAPSSTERFLFPFTPSSLIDWCHLPTQAGCCGWLLQGQLWPRLHIPQHLITKTLLLAHLRLKLTEVLCH